MNAAAEKEREEQVISFENWRGHEEEVERIFSMYRHQISPLTAVYNSVTGSFPTGVMNELRDVFPHMAQSLEDPGATGPQLDRALSHCKRAVVDGFKYASMAYSKIYDDFRETYRHVDLSYVDNGQLLPKLTRLYAQAGELMTEARLVEAGVHTDDQMYDAYEKAFNCYAELYQCVMGAMDAAETVRLRAEEDKEAREKEHRTDRNIGIAGIIVGIAGIVIGFFI